MSGKITHTTLLFTDLSTLNEIPSEFLEPYLVKFFEYIIESVGTGWKTAKDAKAELKGVMHFVSLFGGLHSRIAMSNKTFDILHLDDKTFTDLCQEACK